MTFFKNVLTKILQILPQKFLSFYIKSTILAILVCAFRRGTINQWRIRYPKFFGHLNLLANGSLNKFILYFFVFHVSSKNEKTIYSTWHKLFLKSGFQVISEFWSVTKHQSGQGKIQIFFSTITTAEFWRKIGWRHLLLPRFHNLHM